MSSMTKTLLITGGASGIGAETARRAAKRGYKVAVNYRSRDTQARRIVADIEAAGGSAVALPADMANEADIVRLFAATERALGRSPIWSTAQALDTARGSTNTTQRGLRISSRSTRSG